MSLPLPYYSKSKNFIRNYFETLFVNLGWFIGVGVSFIGSYWIICGIEFPLVSFFTQFLRNKDDASLPNTIGWIIICIVPFVWVYYCYPRLLKRITRRRARRNSDKQISS